MFLSGRLSHAFELRGRVELANPAVISLMDVGGRERLTHVNSLDSVYSIKWDVEQPEIMTFFLSYTDSNGEKRQLYSPLLVNEDESPLIINITGEKDGPDFEISAPNQKVFMEFTEYLVDNLKKDLSKINIDSLTMDISYKINELKKVSNNNLVKDYLDLWSLSSVYSSQRMAQFNAQRKGEKLKFEYKPKLTSDELIANQATIYFPEFVAKIIKEKATGDNLNEKIGNLRNSGADVRLLERMEVKVITEYIENNKGETPKDELIAEVKSVAEDKPQYQEWIDAIKGYKSYLKRGDAAPDDILFDPEGKEVRLSDFKGKYLFIDFWASWCTYCIKEMPALDKIKDKFADSDIQFIAISVDENKGNWEKAMKRLNLNENQYLVSSQELSDKLRLGTIPRYIIYDKENLMLYPDAPHPSQPQELIDLLNSLL